MRFALLLLVLAGACATASSSVPPSSDTAAAGAPAQATPVATAVLEPRSGSNTSGTARITPSASGVVVLIEVQNAAPGDLGVMRVDSNGRGLLVVAVGDLTMDNVVGRSIVVHQTADDLKSDPAGNSGARVACGAIQAAKESN